MDFGIKNRVGIVTGSSQGIGKAIAESLAKEGVNVVICSRNIEKLKNTAEVIENNTGANVSLYINDVYNQSQISTSGNNSFPSINFAMNMTYTWFVNTTINLNDFNSETFTYFPLRGLFSAISLADNSIFFLICLE